MCNIKITFAFLLPIIILLKGFVKENEYTIKKISKECVVLLKNDVPLDSLFIYQSNSKKFNKNQILDEVRGKVYKIERITPSLDDFSNTFIFIQEWEVKDDKFSLSSSLKIPLRDCYVNNLEIKLVEDGIKWKYKTTVLKKSTTGLIPYLKLQVLNEYNLPCR
jgi:hypothetical protein